MKNNTQSKINFWISTAILLCCGFVLFLTCQFRPLLGDDILDQFMYCDKFYTGDPTWVELPPKDTWETAIKDAWYLYNNWSGRVIYLILIALPSLVGKAAYSMITTLTYIGIVIAGGRLEYGKMSVFFSHPVSVSVLSSLIMLYNYSMDYSIMWTFASIYGISFFLYLIILNITRDIVYGEIVVDRKHIVLLNVIGFFAGLTHELLGAWYIIQIVMIYMYKRGLKQTVTYIRLYIGLIIGYIICFFAPGNFIRASSDHDRNIFGPFLHKLFESASQHGQCILKMQNMGIAIGVVFAILIIISIFHNGIIEILRNDAYIAFYIISILLSWIMWSIVAYTPVYGMIGMLVYVILLGMRIIDKSGIFVKEKGTIYETVLALILCILIFGDSVPWICDFGRQTKERENLIEEAKYNGEEEVIIHKYSDRACRHIIFSEYVDNSEIYAEPAEMKYYGIKIIVE